MFGRRRGDGGGVGADNRGNKKDEVINFELSNQGCNAQLIAEMDELLTKSTEEIDKVLAEFETLNLNSLNERSPPQSIEAEVELSTSIAVVPATKIKKPSTREKLAQWLNTLSKDDETSRWKKRYLHG